MLKSQLQDCFNTNSAWTAKKISSGIFLGIFKTAPISCSNQTYPFMCLYF